MLICKIDASVMVAFVNNSLYKFADVNHLHIRIDPPENSYVQGMCAYLVGGCRGRDGKQGEMGRLPPLGDATGRVLYGRLVSDTCT